MQDSRMMLTLSAPQGEVSHYVNIGLMRKGSLAVADKYDHSLTKYKQCVLSMRTHTPVIPKF